MRSSLNDISAVRQSGSDAKSRLAEIYGRYFEGRLADTPALLEEAYRLRYRVYCVENPFEDPAENPRGLETDEFDSRSVHSLLIHRETQHVAGTVRLVLPDSGNPPENLPIYAICDHPLLSDPGRLPPAKTAEISRFAISKQFRQRKGDGRYPGIWTGKTQSSETDHQSIDSRRVIPHMTLGLMNGIVTLSVANQITHWCAVMEPALLRLLARLGIHFEPLGPLVEYHGERQPVYAEADSLLTRIGEEQPEVWEVITNAGKLWPLPARCRKS